jgi:hypothetical protein
VAAAGAASGLYFTIDPVGAGRFNLLRRTNRVVTVAKFVKDLVRTWFSRWSTTAAPMPTSHCAAEQCEPFSNAHSVGRWIAENPWSLGRRDFSSSFQGALSGSLSVSMYCDT